MDSKQIARKWFDEVWNQRNVSAITEMSSPSTCALCESGVLNGPEAFREMVFEPMTMAFPDVKVDIDGLVAEDNEVMIRWTATATHSGPFGEIQPSGRRVKFTGMTWQQMKDGKIVAASDSYNLHGLMAFLATGQECATVRNA